MDLKLGFLFVPAVFLIAALALGACSPRVNPSLPDGQYWQRVRASEAAYTQGPKAQQMLNRDIARCVTELRELERLGQLKNAIPTDRDGRVLNPDELELRGYDHPDRNKHLFMEHGEYHDFETCMLAKGWERVKHVPYDVAERSRAAYLEAHKDYEYQTRHPNHRRSTPTQESGEYGDLNN